MQIIRDSIKDTVYVSIKESETGQDITHHMWAKFGVFPHWDGKGELLGIEFANAVINDDIELKEMIALP
jgi:hypothetical protein